MPSLSLITNGKITGDCVSNDSTFSNTFPYLGNPNYHADKGAALSAPLSQNRAARGALQGRVQGRAVQ